MYKGRSIEIDTDGEDNNDKEEEEEEEEEDPRDCSILTPDEDNEGLLEMNSGTVAMPIDSAIRLVS